MINASILHQWLQQEWPEGSRCIKQNAKRQTWRVCWNGAELLVKRYRLYSFAPWFWLKRYNPANHVTTLNQQFSKAGMRTVKVVGCQAQSQPDKAALLAMEWLADSELLHNYAHSPELKSMLESGLLEDIMRQMAIMHRLGWVHGDMKWGNILVRDGQAWFIDLDGVHRKRPGRNAYRDLARFIVDCEEAECDASIKQIVLECYGRHAQKNPDKLAAAIAQDVDKIHRRHQQRYSGSRGMKHWPTDS